MLKLGDQRGSVVRVARVDILLQPVYVIISLMGLVEFFLQRSDGTALLRELSI